LTELLTGVVLLVQALVHDVHVICGCLKDFLRGLKEPLVTFRLWTAFTRAVGELLAHSPHPLQSVIT